MPKEMNELVRQQYNSLYASKSDVYNDGAPQRAARLIPHYKKTGTVLDVGAGEGQNALYLAEQGFAVTAVDLSHVGLKKLETAAVKHSLAIKTVVGDIETFIYQQCYDTVLFSFILHHLDAATAISVIEQAQEYTAKGGVHIIATFSNEGGLYERAKKSGRYYPSEVDLRALYEDWEVLQVEIFERESLARDKAGNHLINKTVLLAARKSA